MNQLITAQETAWQTRYWLTNITRGQIIAEIEADTKAWADYSTVHKYTAQLFNISERQSQHELSAYKTIGTLLEYTTTQEEQTKLRGMKESLIRAIPKGTDPQLAYNTLMQSTTAKEIKETLRLNEQLFAETETNLKQEEADKQNKANADRREAMIARAKTAKDKATKAKEKATKALEEAEAIELVEVTPDELEVTIPPTKPIDYFDYMGIEYKGDPASREQAGKMHKHISESFPQLAKEIAILRDIDESISLFSTLEDDVAIENS